MKKEQNGVEKPLIAPFAMKVPSGVDGNQKAEEGTDEQINRGNFVEIECNEKTCSFPCYTG